MPQTRRCSYINCDSNSVNNNFKLFSFKKNSCAEWVTACQNRNLFAVSVKNLVKHYYVCAKHFHSDDFTRILSPFQNKLKETAVPLTAIPGELCI